MRAAFAAALIAALLALAACGSSNAAGPATPNPSASPSVAARVMAPRGWGIQFSVADSFSRITGPLSSGKVDVIILSTPETGGGGVALVLRRQYVGGKAVPVDPLRVLNNFDAATGLIPPTAGKATDIVVARPAALTSVGSGWPAASEEFTVTLAQTSSMSFGQRTIEAEVVFFWRKGYLYNALLYVAPANLFEAHRAPLDLTLQTLAVAK